MDKDNVVLFHYPLSTCKEVVEKWGEKRGQHSTELMPGTPIFMEPLLSFTHGSRKMGVSPRFSPHFSTTSLPASRNYPRTTINCPLSTIHYLQPLANGFAMNAQVRRYFCQRCQHEASLREVGMR